MDLSFGKEKHLCGDTTIARLYREGRAFIVFPLRVVYFATPFDDNTPRPPVRILVSAPKKRFRHAVDRNRYRRLLREAYRHRQQTLIDYCIEHRITIDLSLTSVHNRLPDYADLLTIIDKIIDKLITRFDSDNDPHRHLPS